MVQTIPQKEETMNMHEPNTRETSVPTVLIGEAEVSTVTFKGERVVTFAQIDTVHKRPDGTAGRNYRENRERFVEGEDFVELTADEIRRQSLQWVFAARTPMGILITRRGYLKLVKSLNDDVAWSVFDEMIDRYFAIDQVVGFVRRGRGGEAREARLQFKQNMGIAKLLGLTGNQMLLAANKATMDLVGFDMLASMGVDHVAPQNDVLIIPKDIAGALSITSSAKVNDILEEMGCQFWERDHTGTKIWKVTPKGEEMGGVMTDVPRAHGQIGSARQLKWASGIINHVREHLHSKEDA
jgi:hypothetical protein